MLNLFRTNQIAFNILLLVYILLIRGAAFFFEYPAEPFEGQGVLSDWVYSICGTNGTLAISLGIFLVLIQSLLINIVVAKFRMGTSVSLFPGLFYILLASLIPEFLMLSPVLMANTFFILGIWALFETYRRNDIAGNIVNVGFWIGLGSLFYFSEVVFLFLAIFGLSVLRAFRLKEVLMIFLGFLIPYIWVGVFFFWNDGFAEFWGTYVTGRFSFWDLKFETGLITYIKLGVIALLGLIVLVSFNSYFSKRSIQAQKNISVLYWAMFFAAISLLFQADVHFYHFLIFMVPVGILLSFNFFKMTPRYAEAFHLLLFAAVLIWQFHPLWLGS